MTYVPSNITERMRCRHQNIYPVKAVLYITSPRQNLSSYGTKMAAPTLTNGGLKRPDTPMPTTKTAA